MITGISVVSVWVLDQDAAKEFYTTKVRALIAKGALTPGVLATSDCRGDHKVLAERGVEFTMPPTTRPYGVEAVLRDDSGNWYSLTQRTG